MRVLIPVLEHNWAVKLDIFALPFYNMVSYYPLKFNQSFNWEHQYSPAWRQAHKATESICGFRPTRGWQKNVNDMYLGISSSVLVLPANIHNLQPPGPLQKKLFHVPNFLFFLFRKYLILSTKTHQRVAGLIPKNTDVCILEFFSATSMWSNQIRVRSGRWSWQSLVCELFCEAWHTDHWQVVCGGLWLVAPDT